MASTVLEDCTQGLFYKQHFIRPEFNVVIIPILGVLLLKGYGNGSWLQWLFEMLSSLCLLFGTYAFTIILLYQPGSCSEEITDTRPVIKHFLYMCIFSWLAAVLLNWKVIWHLLKLCAVQPREARQIQQYVRGQKMWQWLGIVAFGLACLNTVYVRSILSYNVYLSVTQVTNDYNVLMYFGLAALGTNINVCLQGLVFFIRIAGSGQFRWVENNQDSQTRMAHVAPSNVVMILQSWCLAYTFMEDKGPISTWSGYQLLLFLSLVIDTLFRVCMFFWCFVNSCCFQRCVQSEILQPLQIEFQPEDILIPSLVFNCDKHPVQESALDLDYNKTELVLKTMPSDTYSNEKMQEHYLKILNTCTYEKQTRFNAKYGDNTSSCDSHLECDQFGRVFAQGNRMVQQSIHQHSAVLEFH